MNQHSAARVTSPPRRLGPRDQGKRMTLEEFFAADTEEGYRYELIRGRLVVMTAPNMPHELLLDWLRDVLKAYARQHPEVFNRVAGPGRVILEEPAEAVSAPEPDLLCYANFPHDASFDDAAWQAFSPCLVVEVISESHAEKDLVRNPDLYLQVRTLREYWIVDPRLSHDRPALTVYRRRGRHWQKPIHIEAGGSYTSRFLPGFNLILDRHLMESGS